MGRAAVQATGRVNNADRLFFEARRIAADDSLLITLPDGSFGGVVVLSVDPATVTGFYRRTDLGARFPSVSFKFLHGSVQCARLR